MIGKVIFWLFFLSIATIAGVQLYENLPRSPVSLINENQLEQPESILDYGDTPVFGENMRFSKNELTYYLSPSCSENKMRRMESAFDIFEDTFEIISFIGVSQFELADISVFCSNAEISLGENLFTVGEGGPSRIINTSQFKIIEEGKISLYKETSRCNYPVVELHELLHVFGFDHTNNPKSIMYNVSSCEQRVTPDMVRIIQDLYTIEPLPDLRITDLAAAKKGRYLDFNVTILNEGLLDTEAFGLSIVHKGEEVEVFDIEAIEIGHGRTIRATNVRLPSLRVESLNFVADYADAVKEFNEENNLVQMKTTG